MRTKIVTGMCLTFAFCLLRPSIPVAAEAPPKSDGDIRTGEETRVIVAWPRAKVFLSPPEESATVEAAVDGGPMRSVPGFVLAPATSGDYWLSTASRDRVGNRSEVEWSLLRVDGEPPAIEVFFEPEPAVDDSGKAWLPPGAKAVARADDLVAGVGSLSLAAGDLDELAHQSESVALTLPPWNDSGTPLKVDAGAADTVGNIAPTVSREVFIDAAPPAGRIDIEGPHVEASGKAVIGPDSWLVGVVEDHESGLEGWRPFLDDGETTLSDWAGPWTEGPRTASLEARDRVGNVTRLAPLSFHVDATPPEIEWSVSSTASVEHAGVVWHRSPVTVETKAADASAGLRSLEWSRDGSDFQSFDGRVEIDGSAIHLRATDRVGNADVVLARWSVDDAPPEVFVETSSGERFAPGATVRLRVGDHLRVVAEDEGAGVARIDRPFRARRVAQNESFRFLSAGQRVFHVTAEDRLGHRVSATWPLIVERR